MVTKPKIVDTINSNNNIQCKNSASALNNKSIESTSSSSTTPAMCKTTITSNADASTAAPSSAVALTASGKPKEKRRNNEKRKERSRDAARCRRSRETEIFTELAQVLPLKKEDVQQLDKASVMRIAIAYLKVRDMLKMFPKIQELLGDLQLSDNNTSEENPDSSADTSALNSTLDSNDSSTQSSQISEDSNQPTAVEAVQSLETTALVPANGSPVAAEDFSMLLKQTLDGFLLILSNDGDITYVSGNISDYLGLSKIDILGQQIWEYAHQCDHAELKEALNIKRNGLTDKVKDENLLEEGISTDHRDLFVRLKCTITSRGRSINIKSASYKVIHITGHLVVNTKGDRVLVAMGRPIPHPSNIEVPLGTSTFLTKHSLDMKFTYVDDKMLNLLGYKPEDLLETSLFNCHHGMDTDSLMTTFKNVLSKGQGETCRYRFLGKYGGYCWIVTQATIVYDKLKPQSVVCVNFVISNLEKKHEIYTLQQYEESQKLKIEEKSLDNIPTEGLIDNKPQKEEIKDLTEPTEEKLFAASELNHTKEAKIIINKLETTTTTPLNNNLKLNNNQNNLKEENINVKPIIKQEQIPTIVLNSNNNNNKTSPLNTATSTPNATVATPLLPPPNHCPTTTVTHTVFNKSKPTNGGPKTVTSSLILTNLPTTTSTQSILQQHQTLNVANNNNTRATPQSVTASVFSPLPPTKLPSTTATAAILAQQQPQQQQQQQQSGGGQLTANANHPQDMNKGYLSFAEDATELTMLKEEPDDLTAHLVATNAVDACMPLDESGPLFGEILVGFGMGSYSSLLPDDINSLDSNTSSLEHSSNHNTNNNNSNNNSNNQTINKSSAITCSPTTAANSTTTSSTSSSTSYNASIVATTHNNRQSITSSSSSSPSSSLITTTTCTSNNSNSAATTTATNSTNIDPFINYRDESNDTNCSQHLLSPSVTSKSPEGSSLPSLCSPDSLSQEDDFSYYTMNVDDMDDLTMRAPYIPMNEQDDLPLLTTDDYMWSSGNAFTPDEFSLHTKDSDNLQTLQLNQLLNYQQQQFTQQQQQTQQFSNSLCSSPASTVSSMSPSPIQQQQQQQQQQQNSQQMFSTDSSELAALLCGSANATLTTLQDTTNFTNSLNLNASPGGSGSTQTVDNNVVLTDDLDSVSVASSSSTALDHHQQLQQHCLQQFQEQLQQQRQQQLLSGNCKKEKFETSNNSPSLTPNLCDSIEDTFDNVYSKNSTNLDCWNEFLQINTNENTNTTNNNVAVATTAQPQQAMDNLRQEDCKQQLHMQLQQQQQQQQQTQNIIINAVPLITIQTTSNNKNVLIQQQQQLQQQQQSNTKTLNKVNTIKLTPITSTATIKIIENKQPLMQQQQQQQQNIIKTAYIQATPSNGCAAVTANKRHLSNNQLNNNTLESKRLKSNIMDMQNSNTTSQLLQQLITTPQQQQQQQQTSTKTTKAVLETRWSSNENQALTQQQQQKQQQQQQKQSNSVLKNLLISGCDKTKLTKPEYIIIDDASRSSMQSPDLCLSPSMTRPLQCMTSPVAVLRNYRHNPWIGGPGVLPSPTSSLITNEDSNPPGLTPCDTIDSASDSGIDDISIAENMSPLKRPYEQQLQQKKQIENIYGMTAAAVIVNSNNNKKIIQIDNDNIVKIANNNNKLNEMIKANGLKATPNTTTTSTSAILMHEVDLPKKLQEVEEEEGATMCKRKRSISYLDSSNPLMTPFLMDLCNDDYHMTTKEYLQDNDIENVLNEWPVDLV
ncbi:protein similar isoform X2 [Lucilia cuprina]|uniref:protein similar isoform X2 n=1 Tax=Lucilia cuprina TaxID=7375 RepID=UPI001F0541A0|nr:protein similar isoform X2 [Lucilia cuprina]XP_046804354.1 protein similar isoform X2 [Lucilia cuprina]XP_046804355.1 protein similar isoform X2 [Lucilia cuprina]XP_046804356.1 protein similar isoform X2 [Lucilia cuprina]